MEFWTSVKVILRRWYVVVPCLMATVAIGLYLVHEAKPTYKATGSVLLAGQGRAARPATTPSTVAGVNPYANMDQTQLAYLVSENASGSSFADQMKAAGATGPYTVVDIGAEPAMAISATADTPAAAMTSYHTLVKLLDAELDRRQVAGGAPANTLVGVQDWNSPSKAFPQNAAKVKALIVVVVVGLLLTLALTFLVDALITSRTPWSGHRDADQEDEDEEGDADEPEEPLTGPVAVPAHLHARDRARFERDDVVDDEQGDDSDAEPFPRRIPSRYEFALQQTMRNHDSRSTLPDSRRQATDLQPWSPPEEHPRAAGS
jgi:hypothetical protein